MAEEQEKASSTVKVFVPPSLKRELEAQAKRDERSVSFVARRALKAGLARLPEERPS